MLVVRENKKKKVGTHKPSQGVMFGTLEGLLDALANIGCQVEFKSLIDPSSRSIGCDGCNIRKDLNKLVASSPTC